VIRYRARGAVREVGKALGVPEDVTGALAGLVWGWSTEGVSEREVKDLNLNLTDRRLRLTLELARQLIGTPRHLSWPTRSTRPDARAQASRPGANHDDGG
jgi:error-prone DNA polymerase